MSSVPGAVTDPSRLHTAEVTVESGDGAALRAHLARPIENGARPGIIVVHEAFGLNAHTRDVADRFANAGFDAIAPELFSREGPPDPEDRASVMAKIFAMPDARVVADLEACAAHLRALDSSSGKVGCIGFCMGGRDTLLLAGSGHALDAAVVCWGGFIDRATPDAETTENRPRRVVDLLDRVECPIYLVGGAEDQNPSPQLLQQVRDRLAGLGRDVTLDIFDGAGHAFFADYRPTYREAAAQALWPRVLAFFERTLR